MQVNNLIVTTTPQLVPVQAGTLTVGLDMVNAPTGNPVYFGTTSSVTADPSLTTCGFPIPAGGRDFVPADHFNTNSGSIYAVVARGTQPLSCKSQ